MNQWIWQKPDWKDFQCDPGQLQGYQDAFMNLSGISAGILLAATSDEARTMKDELLMEEAVASADIAGVNLDRARVKAALQRSNRRLGSGNQSQSEQLVSTMMIELEDTIAQPLTTIQLEEWRRHLTAESFLTAARGAESDEAAASLECADDANLEAFLQWFNSSRDIVPAVARAGIAFLWFEALCAFGSATGAISRAIVRKALGQAIGSPPIGMLSETIAKHRGSFLAARRTALEGGLLQDWLVWFSQIAIQSQTRTNERMQFLWAKSRFFGRLSGNFTPRQNQAISQMFEAGPDGFPAGLSAGDYISMTRASIPTATRDLKCLVEEGILSRRGERRYARYHLNF